MLAMKRHCANATRDGQTNIYFSLVSTMGISQGEFSGMVFSFHLYMGLGTELRSPGGEELLCWFGRACVQSSFLGYTAAVLTLTYGKQLDVAPLALAQRLRRADRGGC